MDKQFFFERNLLSLSRIDANLCARLSAAQTTLSHYRFVESKSGKLLSAWVDSSGRAHTLHSLTDPEKEAERLISTVKDEGFLILLGLGSGYYAQAALKRDDIKRVLVIDFDIDGLAELFCFHEYIRIFNDERFSILIDPNENDVRFKILNLYQPALHGGLKTLPLRGRTDFDVNNFSRAASAIKKTLENIAEDYSVQSCFGKRWFSNIIHNVLLSENQYNVMPPALNCAVCAAGPSLDSQTRIIKKERKNFFLIATDTSLPVLLKSGVKPDAVISIDCQHISYYHFIGTEIEDVPLFLDLASPPALFYRSKKIFFFSGGHPLTNYISANYRNFPILDVSGANVTYAAVTLAEKLGARRVKIFGADFSYPMGAIYARGAYFYPFFYRKQNRLQTAESKISEFLYKTPSLKRIKKQDSWYYETKSMNLYKQRLEEKSASLIPVLTAENGPGAKINIAQNNAGAPSARLQVFASGGSIIGAKEFLNTYINKINDMPPVKENITFYLSKLRMEEKLIFTTLLPVAANFRFRNRDKPLEELVEEVKNYCVLKIENILKSD
ncbi:MAG: DUF115 domain-containing protein [Spirochaetaceae bacterium]|jgi:hypothetical protein|nr:DUF115 domain-containing protein [Spirochaetaceae bacterium]